MTLLEAKLPRKSILAPNGDVFCLIDVMPLQSGVYRLVDEKVVNGADRSRNVFRLSSDGQEVWCVQHLHPYGGCDPFLSLSLDSSQRLIGKTAMGFAFIINNETGTIQQIGWTKS